MGSLLFRIKIKDPLVVTSLSFFKPLRLQDATRLLTTVVGLSELLWFKRLYVHGGLVGGGSYSRGTIWRRKLKLTLICSGRGRLVALGGDEVVHC